MKANKVVFGAVAIMDISDSTVTPEDMVKGVTAYDKTGEKIEGKIKKASGGITGYVTAKEPNNGMPYVEMKHTVTEPTVVAPASGGDVILRAPLTDFGNASAADVVQGKTFTSEAGLKVEGNVRLLDGDHGIDLNPSGLPVFYEHNNTVGVGGDFRSDYLCRENAYISIKVPAENFGDAAPEEVAKGKTFTSSWGVKVEGTMEPGAQLPALENPGTAEDLVSGKQLIDTDGNIVSGTVKEVSGTYTTPNQTATIEFDDDWCISNVLQEDVLLRKGTQVNTWLAQGIFGDALPEDVRAGKTFTTGPAGLKAVGTLLVNPYSYFDSVMNLEVTELVSELATRIPAFLQYKSTKLTKVDMPNVVTGGERAFDQCYNLTTVNLPSIKTVDSQIFSDCDSLVELYLPRLETITGWGYTFSYSNKLEKVHLPKLTNITTCSFAGCEALITLILGAGSVCALESINAFDKTPVASGAGYIYVPRALVESYKSATNWSSYADQIRAIEDYPEITGG